MRENDYDGFQQRDPMIREQNRLIREISAQKGFGWHKIGNLIKLNAILHR
jgi:hypothetical protein